MFLVRLLLILFATLPPLSPVADCYLPNVVAEAVRNKMHSDARALKGEGGIEDEDEGDIFSPSLCRAHETTQDASHSGRVAAATATTVSAVILLFQESVLACHGKLNLRCFALVLFLFCLHSYAILLCHLYACRAAQVYDGKGHRRS